MKRLVILIFGMFLTFTMPALSMTHLIVLGSCPPYKHGANEEATKKMEESCRNNTKAVMKAFTDKFNVDPSHEYELVQENATYAKLTSTVEEVKAESSPGDLLVVYVNSHGGLVPHHYKGYPVNSEVFALYTEEEPTDFGKAVDDKVWMAVREFRDMITDAMHEAKLDVVLIFEACHSEASSEPIKHSSITLRSEQRLAALYSARADQSASFSDDGNYARFTENLVSAIENLKKGQHLFDAYALAAEETYIGQLKKCLSFTDADKEWIFSHPEKFYEYCTQQPDFYDPKGLLMDIVFN